MAVREIVTVNDYRKIASTHEHYIWHFLQKKQNTTNLVLFSYFEEHENPMTINSTRELLNMVDIPYFESYTEDSMDFLMDFGFTQEQLYTPVYNNPIPKYQARNYWYNPIILSFNKYKMVSSTKRVCYCAEGFMDLIMELSPKYLIDTNID